MSSTADTTIRPTAASTSLRRGQSRPRRQTPKAHVTGKRAAAPIDDASPIKTKPVERRRTGQRVARVIERFEESVHLSIACTLIAIAIALLVETVWTLVTTGPFLAAACTAVGEVLLVLILVEIARTVRIIPDNNGSAIRKLIVIAIMSALREVLWIGMSPTFAGNSAAGGSVDRPLDLGVSTVAVLGLVFAFALMRRASAKK
jgi:uncharacterized membrane protein (DUF373 family)